ncbi:MAG TPA: hypothetical protein EYG68_02570 [Leucothrix mucor]|nr:hypothetical protein [Leucothrix mucor]
MIILKKSLAAWQSDHFKNTFRDEVISLDDTLLPLQEGLSYANFADGSDMSVLILNVSTSDKLLLVKTGIFYQGLITGCNCSDDPTPPDSHTEYCEIRFEINKITAETQAVLLDDSD